MKIDEVRAIFQKIHPEYQNLEKGIYCKKISESIFGCIEIISHRTYAVNMRVKIGLQNFPTVEKNYIKYGKGWLKEPELGDKIKTIKIKKDLQFITYDIIDNDKDWNTYLYYTTPGNHKFSDENGNVVEWFDFIASILNPIINQCSTEKGILEFLEKEKNSQKLRFGFYNYNTHPYLYYFLLRKLEHYDNASEFLSELSKVQHLSQSDIEMLKNTFIPG